MLAKSPKKVITRVRSKSKGFKIPLMAQLRARQRPQHPQSSFFEPDWSKLHPPGVGPGHDGGPSMAMDEEISSTLGWAQNAIQSVFAEGQTFLGYAFLAQLAQRPEYRNAVEIIATEMTRKWIKLQAVGDIDKTDHIKQLTDELDRLQVRNHFRKVAEVNEYFGRSHLYFDFGTTDDLDELKPPIGNGRDDTSRLKVKKGSLQRLKVVEPVWCYPTNYDSVNPLRTDWYEPDMWYCMATQIHATRLLKFVGHEVPDLLKPAYSFGGLSLSQMGKPYVDNWLRTRQSVADLIHAFSVFVLHSNLSTSLQDGGNEFFERLEMFISLRDNRNVMVVDKDSEDLTNVSAPLGSLDALQAQTQEHLCSVWRIPTIKYLNIQPAGFNASSEGEIRTFYDSINSYQEVLFRPNLTKVIDFIQLSLWGEVDQDITFAFEPLWSLDEAALATKRKTEADTDQVLMDIGAVSQEEVRKRVASDPTSPYASIDVSELPEKPGEGEEAGMGESGEMEPDAEETSGGPGLQIDEEPGKPPPNAKDEAEDRVGQLSSVEMTRFKKMSPANQAKIIQLLEQVRRYEGRDPDKARAAQQKLDEFERTANGNANENY